MSRDDERSGGPDRQRDRTRAIDRERRSRGGKLILVLAIIVLVMLFAVQNSESTRLRFLWFEFQPPLIWVIVVVGLAGALAGYLVGRPGRAGRAGRADPDADADG
ncbi:MAG: LapA family protein [Actinomycetota bacterium]